MTKGRKTSADRHRMHLVKKDKAQQMRAASLAKADVKAAAIAAAAASKAEADSLWPNRAVEQEDARQTKHKLASKKGAVLTSDESRHILMLHATLVLKGLRSSEAMKEVCETFSVGINKVHSIIKKWRETDELKQGSSEGRGVAKDPDNDGRHKLSTAMLVNLREHINSENESGRQVFRRGLQEWIAGNCEVTMSCQAVARLLFRLGFVRRRGRIKIPPLTAERRDRIRRFLVEYNRAYREEKAGGAVLVYMDESFCHQLHGSAYSYFPTDDKGQVEDGMGRTSGKGVRMIMIHAITRDGPLGVLDENTGLPIKEGFFTSSAKEKKEGLKVESLETAEMLWQAKKKTKDYHDSMDQDMFMRWLEFRLTPAFKAKYWKDGRQPKMILVLDNAPYHHGWDAVVGVPEDNKKAYNVDLLRQLKVRRITLQRDGRPKVFKVPLTGSFPQKNSKDGNGVSAEEVAAEVRAQYQQKDPRKLLERAEAFMQGSGWELIWTPPYMPKFQPIELFWQHGKHYVSLCYEQRRTLLTVWKQIRKGWYGDPEWHGPDGRGWKAACCADLVRHSEDCMNEWIANDDGGFSGKIGDESVSGSFDEDDLITGKDKANSAEGVDTEMELDGADDADW